MAILAKEDVHEALERLLQHGTFGMEKDVVVVKFPIHVLDAFISALGFEAHIAVREIDLPRHTDDGDEWRRPTPDEIGKGSV